MTKIQAEEIAKIIRDGRSHKSGHYHHGYIYLSFCKRRKIYEIHHENLAIDIYNPSHRYEYKGYSTFLEYLMEYYDYEEMKAYFEKGY